MLAASLHSTRERGERQFLIEHLDRLSPTDLLLLDRGYPCRWLVAVLNHRAIKFCMRVDKSDAGFACVREFALSGESERIVMLRAPDKQDAIDYAPVQSDNPHPGSVVYSQSCAGCHDQPEVTRSPSYAHCQSVAWLVVVAPWDRRACRTGRGRRE